MKVLPNGSRVIGFVDDTPATPVLGESATPPALPPEPPVGFIDGGPNGNSEVLSWSADTSNDHGSPVTAVNLYLSTSGGNFLLYGDYDPGPGTTNVPTEPGVNYQAYITSVNANGESLPSNTVSYIGSMGA